MLNKMVITCVHLSLNYNLLGANDNFFQRLLIACVFSVDLDSSLIIAKSRYNNTRIFSMILFLNEFFFSGRVG